VAASRTACFISDIKSIAYQLMMTLALKPLLNIRAQVCNLISAISTSVNKLEEEMKSRIRNAAVIMKRLDKVWRNSKLFPSDRVKAVISDTPKKFLLVMCICANGIVV